MPSIAREEDLYPFDLLVREDLDTDEPASWWALYTLSRREKQLMRRLRALEVPFYGPLIEKKSRTRSGRVRTSWLPLFASYVFIRGTEKERYLALTTNCVSRVCNVADGLGLVRDLRQIHHLIESNVAVTPEQKLQPGEAVRVKSGPLKGLEGIIVRQEKQARFLVAIDFLQQGASVSIDDYLVEKI